MKKTQLRFLSFMTLLTFSLGSSVWADEAQLVSLVQNMEAQMAEMQKTIKWQGEQINKIGSGHASAGGPAVAEISESDFDKHFKRKVGEADKWIKGLKFGGDFRLRYEALNEQHNSSANDRNRFRFRLRFGFEKKISDEFKVGFRLASAVGSEAGTPAITSTNTSFDTNFAYKDIAIDRAYATYTPNWAQVGIIKSLEITGGKVKNPFEEGSSLMIWDGDVTPEGVYEQVVSKLLKTDNVDVDHVLTAGQFVLEEGSGSERDDAELWAFQTGFRTKVTTSSLEKPIEYNLLFSYYDFADYAQSGNFVTANGNPTCSGGTVLCAKDFNIFEIYNEVGVQFGSIPKIKVFYDWATNMNERGVGGTTPESSENSWGLGAKIGSTKKKGNWEASYGYFHIEPNAVPGAFNDSDFGHSDRRGSVARLGYALTDNLVFNTSAFFTNRITGGGLNGDNERDLFQADLVWKI